MNSKVIIAIIAVVVILIGGGAALMMANNAKDESKKAQSSASNETSLAALQAKGEPRKCTFSSDVKNGSYSGTAYFSSDKQMRNDYKSTVNGKERNGGMIVSEETQYFWNNETKKGYKMAITTSETSKSSSSTSDSESVDTKAKYNFHCESWTVDASKFTPPSEIAIQDLTQMMQNMPTSN